MKEFEKWIGPDKCPVEVDCKHSLEYCEHCHYLLNVGWKAALEFVSGLLNEHSNSGGGIIDYINKELEE